MYFIMLEITLFIDLYYLSINFLSCLDLKSNKYFYVLIKIPLNCSGFIRCEPIEISLKSDPVKFFKSYFQELKEPKLPEQKINSQSPIIYYISHKLSPIWIQ
jgi:hypothetical protein